MTPRTQPARASGGNQSRVPGSSMRSVSHSFKTRPALEAQHVGMTTLTWNDLPAPPTRWWGFPVLMAMRRDYLAVISAQRPLGDLVAQRILGERGVDVFDP